MNKPKVFVIMPFKDEFYESFQMLQTRFFEKFEFSHAGEEGNQQNILSDIIKPIYGADVIIADLTELNPNVMYELGLAHCFNKKTIIITRDNLSTLPFDLKQYRAKNYSTHFMNFNELIDYLEKNLFGAINDTVIYSNPVKDFLEANDIELKTLYTNSKVNLELEGEAGFLDFLGEIEENLNNFTLNINAMTNEITQFSDNVDKITKKIEKTNLDSGGNTSPSLIRKEAKKIAEYVRDLSKSIKNYNEKYTDTWDKIEKNTLGLLENEYSNLDENKDELKDYLQSLFSLKDSINESNLSLTGMKDSLEASKGLERSLTQAVRFLVSDLDNYLSITKQIISSLNRIFTKSKYILD